MKESFLLIESFQSMLKKTKKWPKVIKMPSLGLERLKKMNE